jgi:hypothetical protein
MPAKYDEKKVLILMDSSADNYARPSRAENDIANFRDFKKYLRSRKIL